MVQKHGRGYKMLEHKDNENVSTAREVIQYSGDMMIWIDEQGNEYRGTSDEMCEWYHHHVRGDIMLDEEEEKDKYNTYTESDNLKIRSGMRDAFFQYLRDLKKSNEELADSISICAGDVVHIDIFDEKIIGFWPKSTLEWFDKLSEYIEGYLSLELETQEEDATVYFIGSGAIYELAQIHYEYESFTSDELMEAV